MIQEDQNHMFSNTSSSGVENGRSNGVSGGGGDDGGEINTRSSSQLSKKLKQKKVPQRGLGVAQLEKIRMEQKKDGNNINNFSSSAISPTNSNSSSSHITIPLLNYPHINNKNHKSSKFNISYTPPPSHPPNPILKTHLLPNTENLNLTSIPPLNGSNVDGWPSIPVHGNGSFPKLWHPSPHEASPDHKGKNANFPLSLSLPYETLNSVPLPDLVNGTSTNLSSSSVLHFPIEPPSNQICLSNYSEFLTDKEKMKVGMKRSCTLAFDNGTTHMLQGKFTHVIPHPLNGSKESTSNGFGGTINNLDITIPIFRDIPSCPSAMLEPITSSRKMSRKENGNFHNGEFLSLAPPTVASSFPTSRFKQLCKFETLPYQVNGIEDPIISSRHGGSSQQQNLFSFLHPTTTLASSPAKHSKCNGELGENVDLNLKL